MSARTRAAWSWPLIAALLLLLVAYLFWPRAAHLRSFDADRVAMLETRMWRSYYEHHFFALVKDLYVLSRDEYGFSPADSIAIAWYAGRAARVFQPTRTREEAQKALPLLEKYFAALRGHSGETFDVKQAARIELDWWQLRREKSLPAEYGAVIAKTTTVVFQADNADVHRAGLLRAEMMTYRDERRDGRMRDADWVFIEQNLARSYKALLAGIARQ